MPPENPDAPTGSAAGSSASSSAGSSAAGSSAANSSAGQKGVPTQAEWDAHKDTIIDLYLAQKKTLKEVMQIMATEHNFKASPKMYNNRFKWWNTTKNMRARNAVEINTKQKERDRTGRGEAEYLVHGRIVNPDRVKKYLKRASTKRIETAMKQLSLEIPDDPSSQRTSAVVVRTPGTPQGPQGSSSFPRSPSPLDTHRLASPDVLKVPEEIFVLIKNFYSGYFDIHPATHTRSMGLQAFLSLKNDLVRFDSQYQALAYIFVEPFSESMFQLLDCYYIEIRDQMREQNDHFLLPTCLHNVFFLSTVPMITPFAAMLLRYLRDGSGIYLGPEHPLTGVWDRLLKTFQRDGNPGSRDMFRALGDYINDRLRNVLGEYNILYLRILHHYLWTYNGFETFQNTINSQIARLEDIVASVLGETAPPAAASFQIPPVSLYNSPPVPSSAGRPSLVPRPVLLSSAFDSDHSAYSSPAPTVSSYITSTPTPPGLLLPPPADASQENQPPLHPHLHQHLYQHSHQPSHQHPHQPLLHQILSQRQQQQQQPPSIHQPRPHYPIPNLPMPTTSTSTTIAPPDIHPDDLRYTNEVKTILRGSLTFGLYVSGMHAEALAAAQETLAGTAVDVLPGVKGCLHSVAGNVAFTNGDAVTAVHHARASLQFSEDAQVSRTVVIARLSRLATFLEGVGDVQGAEEVKARVKGLIESIGG